MSSKYQNLHLSSEPTIEVELNSPTGKQLQINSRPFKGKKGANALKRKTGAKGNNDSPTSGNADLL